MLRSCFIWPNLFKDNTKFVQNCDRCERVGNINRRNEMPLSNILEIEIFYVWGIDFIGPFPPSFGNLYILLAMDYVSKWVEATTTPKNNVKIVVKFVQRHIITRFGALRMTISDEGTHF